MTIKFGYTIVYVEDVVQILDFYHRAFGFTTKFLYEEDNSYGELNTGDTTIGFADRSLGKMNLPDGYIAANLQDKPLGMELVFVTQNVAKVWQQAVTEGAIALHAPAVKPWGQTVAYLLDPQGTLIELCSPMS